LGRTVRISDYNLNQRLIVNIPVTVIMLIGAFYSNSATGDIGNKIEASVLSAISSEKEIVITAVEAEKMKTESEMTVKERVSVYFEDDPVLVRIAGCESSYRHLDKNGYIVRGKVNRRDIGVMQINEYYHLSASKKLGYDIYTLEGNMAYAKYLYEKKGSQPWNSSRACWNS